MARSEELNEIREELKEARRYVRTGVNAAGAMLAICQVRLDHAFRCAGPGILQERLRRISANLSVGVSFIQVNPSVLEGYIDGAVFELSLKER